MKRRTFKAEQAGLAVGAALASELGISPEEARRLVEVGAVYVAGKRARDAGARLGVGQVVTVVLEEAGTSSLAAHVPALALRVLFEDAEIIAVDKPAGINAQPSEGRVGESLVDRVSAYLGSEAGLVHRLDRETSGVTVFGKTARATSALAAEFREGQARKRYVAATGPGLPERGTVDLPLSKDPSRPGRWRATRAANGVPAETDFQTLHAGPEFCLVELWPRTGRTHQLRAHLTALGAPILGDSRYGGAKQAAGLAAPRCLLHAQALQLRHPRTGKPWLVEAPVPEDLRRFFLAAEVEPPSGPVAPVPGPVAGGT
ncbi:RluA family pseudouridine synthase [Corallococcus sp. H22C18031201]|nr:RluA family pseudouridine synthase [Corallococcus sp. H22C18031201]